MDKKELIDAYRWSSFVTDTLHNQQGIFDVGSNLKNSIATRATLEKLLVVHESLKDV